MSTQPMPAREETDREYKEGYDRVMWFAQRARKQGWHLSDRQLVHEIYQRERAARIREQSTLPIFGTGARSAAWNRGQAAALRTLLKEQHEKR
ncbi:MAG TPA: hypothetical protein VFN35_00275 [Ktedonobacteraceae bacterium]|nr:hypothetical protein [Ktedonobacteraceae bacterium]